jgi:hypothetical protein
MPKKSLAFQYAMIFLDICVLESDAINHVFDVCILETVMAIIARVDPFRNKTRQRENPKDSANLLVFQCNPHSYGALIPTK